MTERSLAVTAETKGLVVNLSDFMADFVFAVVGIDVFLTHGINLGFPNGKTSIISCETNKIVSSDLN